MEADRDYENDDLSDEDFRAITDAHNRIVALMTARDPSVVPDALEMRRSGGAAGDDALDEALAALAVADEADGAEPAAEAEPEEEEPPMTRERLADLQSDACAMDVPIEDEMLGWTVAEAEAFFESGGEERPRRG